VSERCGLQDRRIIPGWRAVRTESYTCVKYQTGEKELYNLSADPNELHNLAGKRPEIEAELSRWLAALKVCARDTCREAEN
jgi:N-acetylglucosamine-6-sulfatase